MPSHIIFGKHPVMEVLRAGRRKVSLIHYLKGSKNRLDEILSIARKKNIRLKEVDRHTLSKMTDDGNHQGISAEVSPPKIFDLKTFAERITSRNGKTVIVIMDSIADPHNFGAILRSAESFGIAGAVFPKDRSADISSTVVKTSAGASEYLDFCRVTNIAQSIKELKKLGFHVVAAEADGDIEISKFNPLFPLAIVVGSEGKGVRPLVKKSCDETVSIKITGNVGSLNVSAAASVIFHEIFKKARAGG